MTISYIALGSNMEDPLAQIKRALQALSQLKQFQLMKTSSLYRSQPWGPVQDQPEFINAVVGLETELEPMALLAELQRIEQQLGRRREGERFGPRCIDLDIVLYGAECVDTETLQIPHPRLSERDFVLYPLLEIAPQLKLPQGEFLHTLREKCSNRLECLGSIGEMV